MSYFVRIITSCLVFFASIARSNPLNHLVLKDDFNSDGVADRIIFASKGISGFFQSTSANKKIDTFFLKQGNRSILFDSSEELGGPYLKLSESTGFFTITTIMKLEHGKFKHFASYVLPAKTSFSDSFFDSTPSDQEKCDSHDAFSNKPVKEALAWTDQVKKYSNEELIKKSIQPDCRKFFEKDYGKLEKQIVEACSLEDKTNNLVSCLDKGDKTKRFSGRYKTLLAENVFEDSFKITCAESNKAVPLASFNSSSRTISLFKTTPASENRNFKADFFHEMLHASGVNGDETGVESLVSACIDEKPETGIQRVFTGNIGQLNQERKDGIPVNVPPQVKEVSAAPVTAAMNEGARALDNNFAMDNQAQYRALAAASQRTFKSFEPLMAAAYSAAVPVAFAQNTVASAPAPASASGGASTAATAVALPVSKAMVGGRGVASASSSMVASDSPVAGAVYEASGLPEAVPASEHGELGNGMTVKAMPVSFSDYAPRAPASSGRAGTEVAAASRGFSGMDSGRGLASLKSTDRSDLRQNVPKLQADEEFVKTLTTGKYADVRAKLTDPKNQKILEEKRIQYVSRERTLGSKQPYIILKDLGNKFSILRVTIE